MINIYLDKNKIILSILITLILAFVLIRIKEGHKEGFIFNDEYLKTSCPPKKKKVAKRRNINLYEPKCKDIIESTRNTPEQKKYVNTLANAIPEPDIKELIPIELVPYEEDIIKIAKLVIIKSVYKDEDETQKNLEIIIANTLYDVDKPNLYKDAPYIKKFLESEEIQDILNQETINDEETEEILDDIKKNNNIINKSTEPLSLKEKEETRTTFAKFSERCGITII